MLILKAKQDLGLRKRLSLIEIVMVNRVRVFHSLI